MDEDIIFIGDINDAIVEIDSDSDDDMDITTTIRAERQNSLNLIFPVVQSYACKF